MQSMNKNKSISQLKKSISKDKYEYQINLCNNIKYEVLSILKEYFYLNESTCKISLNISKEGMSVFNLKCEFEDLQRGDY